MLGNKLTAALGNYLLNYADPECHIQQACSLNQQFTCGDKQPNESCFCDPITFTNTSKKNRFV